jgi:hypothetical protein
VSFWRLRGAQCESCRPSSGNSDVVFQRAVTPGGRRFLLPLPTPGAAFEEAVIKCRYARAAGAFAPRSVSSLTATRAPTSPSARILFLPCLRLARSLGSLLLLVRAL